MKDSFNLKTHKKGSNSSSCLIKIAGSPINDFNIQEIEEMAKYLGYVSDRQSGSHKSLLNPITGKVLTYKNSKGQNPGHSFYKALRQNGFSRDQIEFYCQNRKELQREKREFLRNNPNAIYTPRLGPEQNIQPIEKNPETKQSVIDWDSPVYNDMWDNIRSEISGWFEDNTFDKDVLEWLSSHYGVPKDVLERKIRGIASTNKWYKKSLTIRETGSPF